MVKKYVSLLFRDNISRVDGTFYTCDYPDLPKKVDNQVFTGAIIVELDYEHISAFFDGH